jgi:hypothetical protein
MSHFGPLATKLVGCSMSAHRSQADQGTAPSEPDALTVNYKGAEKVVTVTPNTEVVTLVPGDRSELRPGDKIFVPGATENPDGSLEASRLTVGKNGLPPPM